jgi:hypothetical protein
LGGFLASREGEKMSDGYRELFFDKQDQLMKALQKAISLQEQLDKAKGALQSLFDECVIADMLGDLSDAITGETLDKAREVLYTAEQSVQPTPESGGNSPVESSDSKGIAPAKSG